MLTNDSYTPHCNVVHADAAVNVVVVVFVAVVVVAVVVAGCMTMLYMWLPVQSTVERRSAVFQRGRFQSLTVSAEVPHKTERAHTQCCSKHCAIMAIHT